MSVTASAVPSAPATWRRAAHLTGGCALTVDGLEVLRDGNRITYRADVDTRRRRVELIADGRPLRFCCQAAGDHGYPEQPGPRFGWTVARPGAEVSVRVGHVVTVCLHDRDAIAAVAAITATVARHADAIAADLRAAPAPGDRGGALRAAADAWSSAGRRLEAALATAGQLRRVPVRPLREEFLRQLARGEITAAVLAARVGWRWPASPGRRPHGDSARVLRRLGLTEEPSRRRKRERRCSISSDERALLDDLDTVTATVSYDTAAALCRGLRRDPADFGWV